MFAVFNEISNLQYCICIGIDSVFSCVCFFSLAWAWAWVRVFLCFWANLITFDNFQLSDTNHTAEVRKAWVWKAQRHATPHLARFSPRPPLRFSPALHPPFRRSLLHPRCPGRTRESWASIPHLILHTGLFWITGHLVLRGAHHSRRPSAREGGSKHSRSRQSIASCCLRLLLRFRFVYVCLLYLSICFFIYLFLVMCFLFVQTCARALRHTGAWRTLRACCPRRTPRTHWTRQRAHSDPTTRWSFCARATAPIGKLARAAPRLCANGTCRALRGGAADWRCSTPRARRFRATWAREVEQWCWSNTLAPTMRSRCRWTS